MRTPHWSPSNTEHLSSCQALGIYCSPFADTSCHVCAHGFCHLPPWLRAKGCAEPALVDVSTTRCDRPVKLDTLAGSLPSGHVKVKQMNLERVEIIQCLSYEYGQGTVIYCKVFLPYREVIQRTAPRYDSYVINMHL